MAAPTVRSKDEIPDAAYRKMVLTLMDKQASREVAVPRFNQTYIDSARLAANIRSLLPEHSTALLSDIIAMYPIEQGAAELVGYLALADDDIEVEMDDSDETLLEINDPEDPDHARRIRLATVTVKRA